MAHPIRYAPGSAIITAASYATQTRLAGTYLRSAGGNRRRAWKPPRSVHLKMQAFIFDRDGNRCVSCGDSRRWRLELDHIKPYLHGGIYIEWNLQALCYSCNASKCARWEEG